MPPAKVATGETRRYVSPVLKSVKIANFRCLKQATLTLEPLTVLVGPNGSGKSAALAALNPRQGVNWNDLWRHDQGLTFHRVFTLSDLGPCSLDHRPGQGMSLQPPLAEFRYQLLRLDLASLRQPNMLQNEPQLAWDGSNLANVFGSLSRREQSDFARQLCSLVPLFVDVDSTPTSGGQHQLRFQDRWNSSVWYSPDEVSDGTMLLTAFLALQYQVPPVSLVAIEEPERGLHPYLLEQLVDLLRKLSRGEIAARPIQVVLATHSPELLEFVRPEEVRFFTRRADDGSVEIRDIPAADPDWLKYFEEYSRSLRDAWLSGGLGGVPGSEPVGAAPTK